MVLNRIFIGFLLISFVVAIFQYLSYCFAPELASWGIYPGEAQREVFSTMTEQLFASAKAGFELSIYLTGTMCFFMGLMNVAQRSGQIDKLSKFVSPVFTKLFPSIPAGHKAHSSMMMNLSANMLGLDNAATPFGLKAMEDLQELNEKKDTASDAQIMFLVLNTSGLTIIPSSILALRSAAGSENVAGVFVPILITTFISSLVGIIAVSLKQRINLLQPTLLLFLFGACAFIAGVLSIHFTAPDFFGLHASTIGGVLLIGIIFYFIFQGAKSKVGVYDSFIEGAKGGFEVAVKIIPYLVALLCAIALFRYSGALDLVVGSFKWVVMQFSEPLAQTVDAWTVGFMKPLSGGGARALMIDIFEVKGMGPDSPQGVLASLFQGSTETTFYVLAVYFGAVKIKNTRYAAGYGLLADLAGFIAAIVMLFIFWESFGFD